MMQDEKKIRQNLIDAFQIIAKYIGYKHFACSAIITLCIALFASCAARDRSFKEYPIHSIIQYEEIEHQKPASYVEVIYDKQKTHLQISQIGIDERAYVRVYNNIWDNPEVYMTVDMYCNLFKE